MELCIWEKVISHHMPISPFFLFLNGTRVSDSHVVFLAWQLVPDAVPFVFKR